MTDLSVLGPVSTVGAPTLVDALAGSLRTAIAGGDLPAGFRLREIPLAAHFGCSTTPVREAIRKLESEGLVKVYPRRGAEVTAVSTIEISRLYETRMVLESYATRRAAELKPDEAALRIARAVLDGQRAALEADPELSASGDADFHREITALCGNPLIAEIVERTTRQIEAVQARTLTAVVGGAAKAVKAHAAILSAVAAGKADRAESLMRQHLEWAARAVSDAVAEH